VHGIPYCWAFVCFLFLLASTICARCEEPFPDPVADTLRVPASRIQAPRVRSQVVDLRQGIGPDEAAEIALYSNPALRSIRDRRGLAVAQLVQAGILPNPVVSYERDFVSGGNTAGTVTGYNLTAAWEISALVPYLPRQTAARKNFRAVDLDVAWQEWQIAMNARAAVYRVLSLDAQVARAREANDGLQQSTEAVRKAMEAHEKTVLDLAAAESASQDSRATMLALQQEFEKQRLRLKRILGVEPETNIPFREGLILPTRLVTPDADVLFHGLESRRLDLLGLQQGLESQNATVRAAILAQFPKMSAAFVKASDTSNIHTTGFNVAIDVPIFDRNQGLIASERATRQRLRDEYRQRVFEARSDIAIAIADIHSLNQQIAAAEEAVPLLEKLVSSAQTAVEQRNADVLSYYTARSNLLQKRIQLIKLQEQLLEAHTALEIASGRYLPINGALQAK
jgi:cobalt-zinc-cadmium efflux system outer membrane protein